MAAITELSEHVYVAGLIPPSTLDTTTAAEVTAMQYIDIDGWEGVLVVVSVGTASDAAVAPVLTLAHSAAIDTDLEASGALSSDTFELLPTSATSDISATTGRVFVGDIDFKAQGWTGGYIQPVITTPVATTTSILISAVAVLYGGQGNSATRNHADQQQTLVTAY